MKTAFFALPVLAFSLAACGDEVVEPGEPKSIEEVMEEASGMTKPLAGEYRSTTELVDIEIPGAPAAMADQLRSMMGGQFSQSTTSCITQEQADEGFEQQFRDIGEGMNGLQCDFEQFDVDGNDVDAKLACSGENDTTALLTMDGTMDEERQTIAMSMDMNSPQIPGGSMNVKVNVVTERTGDCS